MKLEPQFNTCDLPLSKGVNEPIRLPVLVSRACSMNPLNWSAIPTRSTVYKCVDINGNKSIWDDSRETSKLNSVPLAPVQAD